MKKIIFILFLLVLNNLESHSQVDPCINIQTITIGNAINFHSHGIGDSSYTSNFPCSHLGLPTIKGQESIFQLTVPDSGYYQVDILSATGAIVNYGFKDTASGCSGIGWTCISRSDSVGPLGVMVLHAGQTVFIEVNAEDSVITDQQFIIHSAINVCNTIQQTYCDTPTYFLSSGYGDPLYNNHMPCSYIGGPVAGGQETIYKFIAPSTGYYRIEVLDGSGAIVNYGYKQGPFSCNNLNWTCIGRTDTAAQIGGLWFNALDTIYFLANTESPLQTIQHFNIHCGVNLCNNIQNIFIGVPVSFSSIGYGNPNYNNQVPCFNVNNFQGGQENIYNFTAPSDGYYQIEVLSASGALVNYGYRAATGGCNPSGWSCINQTGTSGHIGAMPLFAGQSVYILVNAEGIQATNQQFVIHNVLPNVCSNIQNAFCGIPVQFSAVNYGDPNFSNYKTCGISGTGGQETIYQFSAPDSGVYQAEILSASGSAVAYAWKYISNGCNKYSWSCIDSTSFPRHLAGIYFNAGDSVYILANATGIQATSQQFVIQCGVEVCNNIQTVTCGTNIQFSSSGYGNPNYNSQMPCTHTGNSVQGGQESIYQFTAPDTGYYQIEILSASGSYVNYGYKQVVSGCNNTNWNCINRTLSSRHIGSIFLNAGESIYILANAEDTTQTIQQFIIHCGINICNSMQTVTCGSSILFSSKGYGNPDYNSMIPCSHSGTTKQGGQETIYQFTAPDTGYYQVEILNATGSFVNYGFKNISAGCNDSNWNCINRKASIGQIGALSLNAGQTIYMIANAEDTQVTNQEFIIHCGVNACNNIQTITCGSTIQFNSFGFGDQNYKNKMPCTHLGNLVQGGPETIYQFTAPDTGYYQVEIIVASGSYVNYGYKQINSGCNDTNWICLNRAVAVGHIGAISLNAGETIFILANAEDTINTSQQFIIHCAIDVCNILPISNGIPVQFYSNGYGDPGYNDHMPCTYASAPLQGGQEVIYRLNPSSSSYQVTVSSAFGNVNYGWKYDSLGCSNIDWNCMMRVGTLGTLWINAGTCKPVLLLLNAEPTYNVHHTFTVNYTPCTTDVPENNPSGKFHISPNPVKDILTIGFSGQNKNFEKITICNLFGKKILIDKNANPDKIEVNVSELLSGIYFISIEGQWGIESGKFVKE